MNDTTMKAPAPTGRRRASMLAAVAAGFLLAACGGTDAADDRAGGAEDAPSARDDADAPEADGAGTGGGEGGDAADVTAAEVVHATDLWVISGEEGMSAGYGVLTNSGPDDVLLVAVTTAASPEVELHEVVPDDTGESVMREMDGGIVVPAGGEHLLEPGGDHFMLMEIVEPILAGDEIVLTLTFDDGSTLDLTAQVRDFTGGHEHYEHDEHGDGHEGDDHEGDGHDHGEEGDH